MKSYSQLVGYYYNSHDEGYEVVFLTGYIHMKF